MLETTIAGSLPKPLWLAETEKLWPAWKLEGAALAAGKIDVTLLAVKLQEDAASTSSATASRRACISSTVSSRTWTGSILPGSN